jgi:hypothetical protein
MSFWKPEHYCYLSYRYMSSRNPKNTRTLLYATALSFRKPEHYYYMYYDEVEFKAFFLSDIYFVD